MFGSVCPQQLKTLKTYFYFLVILVSSCYLHIVNAICFSFPGKLRYHLQTKAVFVSNNLLKMICFISERSDYYY